MKTNWLGPAIFAGAFVAFSVIVIVAAERMHSKTKQKFKEVCTAQRDGLVVWDDYQYQCITKKITNED